MKTLKNAFLVSLLLLSFSVVSFAQTESSNKVAKIYQNVKVIEIDAKFASTVIIGSDRTDVDFVGEISGDNSDNDITIKHSLNGSTLSIEVEDDSWFFSGNNSCNLTLIVPKNIHLDIESGSGEITVRNINDQDADFSSGSGNLHLSELTGSGECTTGSGSIKLSSSNGKFECHSGSGDVRVDILNGEIEIGTGSGSIKLSKIKGKVEASSGSGSINISNSEGVLNLSTASGSIDGNSILVSANSQFNTASGSIEMGLLNPENSLSFELSAASGSLEANGVKGSHNLTVNKGLIKVVGSTASGSQKFYLEQPKPDGSVNL